MGIKRCISPFVVFDNGVPRVISGGDLIDDSDPVLRGRTQYFEDVEVGVKRDLPVLTATAPSGPETATAEPGERRTVRRGRPPGSKNKPKEDGQ